jgi:superfamily II DNA or RNA helicase/diadenosine tetraphosphate (Ap4A) HIT family hydrolase/HKD family nuclease
MTTPQPEPPCPFCFVPKDRTAFEDELTRALWDSFPVSPGHLLIVPRRHIPTWFDASEQERVALTKALDRARDLLADRHHPDGYNIGLNVGKAAGQTVFHLHIHLIPRYEGDVPDPRGGVRHVIPGKGNYLSQEPGAEQKSRLVKGGEHDPLMPYLSEELTRAQRADIAVGFAMRSGVVRMEEHLRDFLDRGGRLRLLTGDYLGITDPDALTRLLDLPGDRHIRVFETDTSTGPAWPGPPSPLSFHPKAYVFHRADGTGAAFVGSSNLSESALETGIEWNYRTVSSAEGNALADVAQAFESLFAHPATQELTPDWIDRYRARRPTLTRLEPQAPLPVEIPPEPRQVPEPHAVQVEALAALQATRAASNTAGLVVLATGLGKTWLSAFDSNHPEYRRILFVAHREEILTQSRRTFRAIRPQAKLGSYDGQGRDPHADVLFASIQTLGRTAHLERFGREAFDYIVVDEFHHAAAPTYRRLIDYFRPKFLLGLTATPERTDGGDLLALCQENLVYRCDLIEGARRDLLCRFQYFGVPDEVDYSNIPWRNARFDEDELTRHVATQSRAQNAYDQLQKRGGQHPRCLAFCVSQRHADFMAAFFKEKGLRAVAVHSGPTSKPRAKSLEELSAGHLDVICAVDVFNEGLDLPELDTVLMLRPTESRILWLQQFGRGLRKTAGDKQLTVIDYIGNHRTFLLKPQTLFSLQGGGQELLNLLERARKGPIEIAPGCYVTYDLATIDILRALARVSTNKLEAIKRYYEDFTQLHGVRPRAVEAFHDGYNPRALRQKTGSWLGFVASLGGLDAEQASVHDRHRAFLDALETTEMVKSYKMLVLLAMLNEDRFPGEITLEELTEAVLALASRNHRLREDLGPSSETPEALQAHLERNPIEAWTGGRGTGGTPYFAYENRVFRSLLTNETPTERAALQELTRELADWRLAEYVERLDRQTGTQPGYVCKVSHAGNLPMLFLPSRDKHPDLPLGTTPLQIDGVTYEAEFVKVALNVVHTTGESRNRLPEILRGWFGPNAGAPGTRHEATLEQKDGTWTLRPLGKRDGQLQLWRRYSREQIPGLFGFPFSTAIWNAGFVVRPGHIFLLVTLSKKGKSTEFQYRDRFLSPTEFQWESQNKTAQDSAHGRLISTHQQQGIPMHLFVRATGKPAGGGPAPFVYCGDVEFAGWEGDKPITVRCQLPRALPDNLGDEFGITLRG